MTPQWLLRQQGGRFVSHTCYRCSRRTVVIGLGSSHLTSPSPSANLPFVPRESSWISGPFLYLAASPTPKSLRCRNRFSASQKQTATAISSRWNKARNSGFLNARRPNVRFLELSPESSSRFNHTFRDCFNLLGQCFHLSESCFNLPVTVLHLTSVKL